MLEKPIYIRFRGRIQGPFSVDELRRRAERGRFNRHYQISTDKVEWSHATDYPELFPPLPKPMAFPQPVTVELAPDVSPAIEVASVVEQSIAQKEELDAKSSWYYAINSLETGPVTFSHLQDIASGGNLPVNALVWTEGMAEWVEAYRIPGVFRGPETAGSLSSIAASTEPLKTCGMAVASFVFGMLGTCVLFFLGSILAVIFGHVALRQIDTSRNRLTGRGMAIAGLILGYIVFIAIIAIGIIAAILYLILPSSL